MLNAICSASGRHVQRDVEVPAFASREERDSFFSKLKCSCGAALLPALWTGKDWVPAPASSPDPAMGAPKSRRRKGSAA